MCGGGKSFVFTSSSAYISQVWWADNEQRITPRVGNAIFRCPLAALPLSAPVMRARRDDLPAHQAASNSQDARIEFHYLQQCALNLDYLRCVWCDGFIATWISINF
jgi:hypothetical protein